MANDNDLSEREREILGLVATGASNKQIARNLVISTNTVKVHLRNIFAKIDVVSRTEATLYAIRAGLVQVGEPRTEAQVQVIGEEPEPPAQAVDVAPDVGVVPREGWRRRRAAAVVATLALVLLAAGTLGLLWRQGVQEMPPPPTATPQGSAELVPSAAASRWRERAPMPTARGGLAVAAYEGRIYAIAGEAAGGPTSAVERYDPTTDSWVTLSPKPLPVADVGAAVVGGRIYVPGGRLASGSVTSTLEVYDPVRDAWERRAPLPVAVSAYALVAFEGRLYVFGGWDGAGYVASVYEYDPRQDSWRGRTAMPTARGYAGAAVGEAGIFVVGGYDGSANLAATSEYTPSREDGDVSPWRHRADLPDGRGRVGVTSIANLPHLFGGEGADPAPMKYSTVTDVWEGFEPPPGQISQWSRPGVAAVDTRIYVVGGEGEGYRGENREYQAIYTIVIRPVISR